MLRGINTGGSASTVGVYVDETPFGSSSGLANGAILAGDFDTFDVSRIEVLRGPQGTVYGASALGGVLKYVTNEPTTDGFEGRVRGTIENVDGGDMTWSGAALVNIRCPTAWRFAPPASTAMWAASSIRSVPADPTWRTTSMSRPYLAAARVDAHRAERSFLTAADRVRPGHRQCIERRRF